MAEVDPEALSRVMSALGKSRSEAKQEAVRANLEKARASSITPEARKARSAAQKERRERERAAKETAQAAAVEAGTAPPKKPRGRPVGWRKHTPPAAEGTQE